MPGFDFAAAAMAWDAVKAVRAMAAPKPEQQTAAGIFPTLEDEAILLAVDEAVARLSPDRSDIKNPAMKVDGRKVMRKIKALRKRLKPHQRERWRKIIAVLELTEHFEVFATSIITKTPNGTKSQEGEEVDVPFGTDGRRQANQKAKKGGLHEVIKNFQRVARDYEYTWEDPRVGHLVYVASLITTDDPKYDPANSTDDFKDAYEYLLGNFFDEKSISELAIEKTKKLYEDIMSGAYDALISLGLSDDLKAAEQLVPSGVANRIALLDVAYEQAIRNAIARKRGQIEAHRDGIQMPQIGRYNRQGEYVIWMLGRKIPTFFSPSTWAFIITTIVIFVVAASQ